MGIGPSAIALYRRLRLSGQLKPCAVMEIGSQNLYTEGYDYALRQLFLAFGATPPSRDVLAKWCAQKVAARTLYEALGFEYSCLDTDGRNGALVLDLNFDQVPAEHRGRYDFVTNHGTTEHVFNQRHAFEMIHEFASPGGLMLHLLPMLGHINHGLFNYSPAFYFALAESNAYEMLGSWVALHATDPSLVPWCPQFFAGYDVPARGGASLCVLLRKGADAPFRLPSQGIRTRPAIDGNAMPYGFVIDGEVLNGRRARYLTSFNSSLDDYSAWALARELLTKRIPTKVRQLMRRGLR